MARKKYRQRKFFDDLSLFQRFFCALRLYHYRKRMEKTLEISSEESADLLEKGLRSIQQIEEGGILPDPIFIRRCCKIFTEKLDPRDPFGKKIHLRYQDFYGKEEWEIEDYMRGCNKMKNWKNKLVLKVLETKKGRLVIENEKRRIVFDVLE